MFISCANAFKLLNRDPMFGRDVVEKVSETKETETSEDAAGTKNSGGPQDTKKDKGGRDASVQQKRRNKTLTDLGGKQS